MSEILFENNNATIKKVIKEDEKKGSQEYVYLDLLDENGNSKVTIPLKEPKKEEQKTDNK